MPKLTNRTAALGAVSALAVAASLAFAGGASAQVATSTLRGTVYEGAAAEAGGTITATEVATGYVSRGRVNSDGGYVIPGLRPGTYRITVTTADGQTATDTVTLALGQVGTLDLDVGGPTGVVSTSEATDVGDVVITGRRLFEVRTPEVATNVSQAQINNLPQISRNFLNFAALAPGVRVTEGENERTISAGGQTAQAINVFIDGQNQKSNIIDGGVGGQDDSRGNPFPQAAVQEFRVLTQNFKAEYEQASSAIIAAVTRSGTNEFHGDAFVTYQNQEWIAQDEFSEARGDEKPDLERIQYGFSAGGPIIEDRLHYFLSYERKDETRAAQVFLNRTQYESMFADELGTFETPFEEDLWFGKLSFQPDDRQRLDLSVTWRDEADIRDVGGQNAYARANQVNTNVTSVNLRHQFQGNGWLNEASVDYYSYEYNPMALNFSDYGRQYYAFRDDNATTPGFQYNYNARDTVLNVGGQSNNQEIQQENWTLRDDLTFTDIEWNGIHTVKLGAKWSNQNYYVNKMFGRNPQFIFDIEGRPEITGSADIPVSVVLGASVPPADVSNNVIGLYIQDDWQITDKLELNLGLRWDYEDNAVNNDYETPAGIRNMLAALEAVPGYDFPEWFNPADYISDGDREAYTKAFQPRIGFSYDIYGDESIVLFGGAGRYYDRIGFNFAFDERYKQFEFTKEIFFSQSGGLVNGQNTVAWSPTYLTAAGLDPLLAAAPGAGEVFLVKNDAPPPRTDQFNLGARGRVGQFLAAVTLAYNKTANEFAWYRANSSPAGVWSGPTPASVGFPQYRDSVFISNHEREREYLAAYFTLDKPYTADSGWGFNLAYTLSEARQNGSRDQGLGAFDFDYRWIDFTPWFPSATDERHRVVISGIKDLPWGIRGSTLITLGSGLPKDIYGAPGGFVPWNQFRPEKEDFILPNAFAFRQVDVRLSKEFQVWNGDTLELILDGINIFNFRNYSGFEQCVCSVNYGVPSAQFLPTQSFQVGLRYRW
jgi:hypothetical protein